MDALTVALAAGIGVVTVAIIGVIVLLVRRGRTATRDLWEAGEAPLPADLAPFWHRSAPEVARPVPPSTAPVQMDTMARVALEAWQEADGSQLDGWLTRHEERLRAIAASIDRAAAYEKVLRETSATEERDVHDAIDRAPDGVLREHLLAMQRAGVDALIQGARRDLTAASHSYAAYTAARARAEARVIALAGGPAT